MRRLSNLTLQSTLFVPDNSGLASNQVSCRLTGVVAGPVLVLNCVSCLQTLSQQDIEFHLSEGQALPLSLLRNGSRIRTRVGSLTVLGVADLLNPSALVRFMLPSVWLPERM